MRVNVPKAQWLCRELMRAWSLKEDTDIRRLIMQGELRPFSWFDEPLTPVTITDDGEALRLGDDSSPRRDLWAVQRCARRVRNFDFAYHIFCDSPEEHQPCTYWAVAQPLSTDEVLSEFVFSAEDVARYEREQRLVSTELSTKEENTRDKLITGLAMECLGWEPWRDGSDLKLQPLLDCLDAVGLPVNRNTAKAHIKDAWERAAPKL